MAEFKKLKPYEENEPTGKNATYFNDDYALRIGGIQECYALPEMLHEELFGEQNEECFNEFINQGYGLEVFVTAGEKNKTMLDKVDMCLKEHGYKGLRDWADENPDRVFNKVTLDKVIDYKIGDREEN